MQPASQPNKANCVHALTFECSSNVTNGSVPLMISAVHSRSASSTASPLALKQNLDPHDLEPDFTKWLSSQGLPEQKVDEGSKTHARADPTRRASNDLPTVLLRSAIRHSGFPGLVASLVP